ncbi:hypothetical protein ROZALSC1DRAFT_20047 [Rozella allomycis CSF55]|uniref:Uncharacterized protein n=1 Tax=Rozella allomycis (strain CSF55) TaxID=988480 RepID=A0A4P9YQD9_ROZAC|nr:hypothetical protein ROZALSC1DRAFT_20047 [Rozella allomycis CSF55]
MSSINDLGIDAKNLSRNELADVIRRHLEDGDLNKENRPIETPRVKKRGAAFKVIDNLLDHSEESNRRKEEDGLDKEIFESPANVFQEEPNFVQDEKDEQKCAELCEKSKPEIVIRKKRNWNPLKMVANQIDASSVMFAIILSEFLSLIAGFRTAFLPLELEPFTLSWFQTIMESFIATARDASSLFSRTFNLWLVWLIVVPYLASIILNMESKTRFLSPMIFHVTRFLVVFLSSEFSMKLFFNVIPFRFFQASCAVGLVFSVYELLLIRQ